MTKTIATFVATTLVVLAASLSAVGQETSGQIIKELVDAVDRDMTSLESRVSDFSVRKSVLTKDLKEKYEALHKTKDKMERENILTDMLVNCAELNAQDIEEVTAYRATVCSLVPKLAQLREEVRQSANMGFEHEKQFTEYRARMGTFLQNSAMILDTLRKTSPNPNSEEEILPIEQNLVSLYRVLNSSIAPTQASTVQIEETIRALEETYSQLDCVARLLEQERLRLRIDNFVRLSKLALMRLFEGRLNVRAIGEIPGAMMDGIVIRSECYLKGAQECGDLETRTASPSRSTSLDNYMAKMRDGDFSWNAGQKGEPQ